MLLTLNKKRLRHGVAELSRRDDDLASIVDRFGVPPLWARKPGFPTLIRIILEQQVSLASADAAYQRLREAVPKLTPGNFLCLNDVCLRSAGFSRQKTAYCRELARALKEKRLRLDMLEQSNDEIVREQLKQIKGIGDWTADIYLLMAARRPDIWPSGDLALIKAVSEIKQLEKLPGREEFDALGESWRPWRAVAARLLWHYYLNASRRQT